MASALTPERMQIPPVSDWPAEVRAPGPKRRVVMLTVLPSPPPCFEADSWQAYAQDAAEHQRHQSGPLAFLNGKAYFNRGWSYCEHCLPAHAVQMDRQDRCHPDFHRRPKGNT
jgi:hypothetical protein